MATDNPKDWKVKHETQDKKHKKTALPDMGKSHLNKL